MMVKRLTCLRVMSTVLASLILTGSPGRAHNLTSLETGAQDKSLDLVLYDAGLAGSSNPVAANLAARQINRWVAVHVRHEAGAAGGQSPEETILRRSGDSLDHAVLKAALLQRLGLPPAQIGIVLSRPEQDQSPLEATLLLPAPRGTVSFASDGRVIRRGPALAEALPIATFAAGQAGAPSRAWESQIASASVDPIDEAIRQTGLVPGEPVTRAGLARLNQWANQAIHYRSDRRAWNMTDYFQTPLETLVLRSGDCEDYAILKAAILQRLGIAADALAYQPVRTSGILGLGSASHMVLTVRLPGEPTALVLDSLYAEPYLPGQRHRALPAHRIPIALMDDILSGRTIGPRILPQSPYAGRRIAWF